MPINYWAILVCAILAMVLGAIWYGPLFGKTWLKVVGVNQEIIKERAKMMEGVWMLYIIQFLLALFQIWVLAYYISGWKTVPGITHSLWIWAGFVVPTVAAGAMWNNDSAKISWARFLIQAGYQLVCFIIFGLILGYWT